ncbi:MAG: hypothetical protein JXX28_17770, partial [Deltaproteobacteria bacterium]|nr:hypothetical protein [Deltaproteobacteria bacterium]
MYRSLLLLLATGGWLAAPAALATVTEYSDATAFLAAAGPTTLIDFATLDDGAPLTDPSDQVGFDCLSLRGVAFGPIGSYYNAYLVQNPSAPIALHLPPDTHAVGLKISPFYTVPGTFTVTLSTGEVFHRSWASGPMAYIGYLSDAAPIAWMTVTVDNGIYFYIDDLSHDGTGSQPDGDGDGVIDLCDTCPDDPGLDQTDTDGDGFGDLCDTCPEGDDALDGDGDGTPDDCDTCPYDNPDDTDDDGVCEADDRCAGDDASGDTDADGVCDDADRCAGDDTSGDTDADGVCDDADRCAGDDAAGDTDADGVCDDADLCAGDDASGDTDADGVCDDTDRCQGDDAAGDTDADGVCDDADRCQGDDA